ncbi:MAG: hypothetical protein IJG38_05185 [Thermoguttaceae bacterium]|nr:hypothetical protein [Thermoguttaceae bacterium]
MRIAIFILTALLSITAMGQTPMYAPTVAQSAPQTQYLLKTDYNVLEGTVRLEGRYYIVQSVNGGSMYVPKEQTLVVCNNMQDVYSARVAAIQSEDAVSYLNLTDWCIKYKMLDKAEQHLAYAKRIQYDYPYIPVMERRLSLAKQQLAREMDPANNQVVPDSSKKDPITQINKLRSERTALEQIAKNMPGDTLKQFSMEIQPILLNSCGTANCHGSADNDFQLIRTPQSHNITLKNLYAVLRQVDRNTPDASRLLTMSTQAHGGLDVPVFSRSRTSAYSRLVGWTYRVARPSQSLGMDKRAEYDSMFGDSTPVPTMEDQFSTGQNFMADNSPAEPSVDPIFNGMDNDAFDAEPVRHPTGRRTSSPNVKRGNPDPMFYAEQEPAPANNAIANDAQGTLRLPQPPGEDAAQYTDEFDYNKYGNSTVKTMRINGESYASPAGLPGPNNVPTPARQRLDQIETNQRLYGNPDGPVETQAPTQQLNASTQFDNAGGLTEAERKFYGLQSSGNAANVPQQQVPQNSQFAAQNTQFVPDAPNAQLAPQSPAIGSNYKSEPEPAPEPRVQTPQRRRTPPPSDDNSDGFDAYPRLDKLFGN